ncbi:hypothetical protein ACX0G7_18685 [Flavitalea antarctica]
MIPALSSYLHQHKSLSIPGIGTIYIERTPARSDFTNKQILPPGYHYRFDRFYDTPDKNFFSFIARKKNVADYEAMQWYNEWAYGISAKLKADSIVSWDGVGALKRNDTGDVFFEAIAPIDAFLQPVPATRIIRTNTAHTMLVGDKELTNLQMSGYLHDNGKQPVQKKTWPVYALIGGLLVIIILFVYFGTR